ncbi:unnamed protein product [Cylicocyclus nassatus]|uniref:Uncharacterized protein n=1 Tax=Cylicocyclus nassatus TaxID=53992 RepID=A0AA36MA04_CYLNA|nr:unnamed protein product [Cylicocyclus nassatus]
MKPSLLAIIFLTGSVHSRSFWDFFNQFFGNKTESEEQNKIPGDNEDAKGRKPAEKPAGGVENNEIVLKQPPTHERTHIDNRVGGTYSVKGDISTEEGYKTISEKLRQYLGNLSGQDSGTHIADLFFIYDVYYEYPDDPFDGYGWDPNNPFEGPDHSDYSDYSYYSDFGYPEHDELK